MDTRQRGPIIVFAALLGVAFLCLCLVVAGVGVGRLANAVARADQGSPILELAQPIDSPASTLSTAPQQPAASTDGQAPAVFQIDPSSDMEPQILHAVYEKANPSVVKIVSLGAVPAATQGEDLLPQGQGSGFVWDSAGHIVTNAHVVEGTDTVQVIFADDRLATGTVLGADAFSDLAVIKIDPTGLDLTPVELGNIDELQVGDRAIAIGAPFDFAGSMTVGTVSGLGRSIRSLDARYTIPEVIQTDAPINPGNSGGPLLDSLGRVIGVNAQIRSEGGVRANSGVGFAIPIYIAQRVIPALIEQGQYTHPFLGVSGQTFSPEWAEALGFPVDARGAYVTETVAGGPAADAGLRGSDRDTDVTIGVNAMTGEPIYLRSGGDLIIRINDQPVEKFDDLLAYLFRNATAGDKVQLTVLRADGAQELISVKLGARPTQ
ncbi:MAG TPA: trypsin-like peptidase domain-containing protein [Anaerolineae bacterium]|nr:trypsin-like peptidase domain-containing protein [Anaerolineae bacterium]